MRRQRRVEIMSVLDVAEGRPARKSSSLCLLEHAWSCDVESLAKVWLRSSVVSWLNMSSSLAVE